MYIPLLGAVVQHPVDTCLACRIYNTTPSCYVQTAAERAGMEGWPCRAVQVLTDHVVRAYRDETARLLARGMHNALKCQHIDVAACLWSAMQQGIPSPEVFMNLLEPLARRGQQQRIEWVLQVAPTALTKAGPGPALAALESGHEQLAQLLMPRGKSPPEWRSAAARGRLVNAIKHGDLSGVQSLVQQVGCPITRCWTKVLQGPGNEMICAGRP